MITPVRPMLAVAAEPFDSPEYLFEIKWNGIRALAAAEGSDWQLWGRELADYRPRYPELAGLARLPAGTVVDGELVRLEQGRPILEALLSRHQLVQPRLIQQRSQCQPVCYVLFDVLAARGHCLLGQPWTARREILQELVAGLQEPHVVLSEVVPGSGRAFLARAVAQGHEGVMAKHHASRYGPGRRSAAWKKIKPWQTLVAVAIGFVPGRHGLRRLLVAAPRAGRLQYVARLHTGFSVAERVRLQAYLAKRVRSQPLVRCPGRAVWVEPVVYCMVRCLEWTAAGRLRGASFLRTLEHEAARVAFR
jgi:bifunctional non-homologous end joining protein LigD/DNA ligase-1